MRHLAGFMASLDSAGVFATLNPLADPMLFTTTTRIRVPNDTPNILWAAGGADGVVNPRFRLTSPTLQKNGRPEIRPLNVQNAAAVVPDFPTAIEWFLENPLGLSADELLLCELNNNPAAAQFQWLLLEFCDKTPAPIVNGIVQKHRATSATAAVQGVWTNVAITFDDDLQPGTYAVIGFRPESATMIASRIVFLNDPGHRPGALGGLTAVSKTDKMFRAGRLGEYGRFPFTQVPTVDVLANAADATQTFEFDLIRVSD